MKANGTKIKNMDKVRLSLILFPSREIDLGKIIITSGDVYTGSFHQDAIEGEGIMLYHNGDRYKGEFSQNKRHGFGKCLYKNGDRYKGSSTVDMYYSLRCR